jgi:RND family efflux transporter MFP subunit
MPRINPFPYLFSHKAIMGTLVVAVVLVSVISVRTAANRRGEVASATESVPQVTLLKVSEFRKDRVTVTADGTVEALDQAELRGQISAPVARIFAGIGDKVGRGQALVALENADLVAQRNQAFAGVHAQEARLQEMKKGARDEILSIKMTQIEKAKKDIADAYRNAALTLNDTYAKGDQVVRTMLDPLFVDDETEFPRLSFQVSASHSTYEIEQARRANRDLLDQWKEELATLQAPVSTLLYDHALEQAKLHLQQIQNLTDLSMEAVVENIFLPSATVGGYTASIAGARASLNAASASLNGQAQTIAGLKVALELAEKDYALSATGATAEQIAAQKAMVEQAQASVAAVQAMLAKTSIRAPFAGTVASLPVHTGELVNPGQLVVSVVNNKGLRVRSYISEKDLPFLAEDAEVFVGRTTLGKVVRISPSIEPNTKKVEVIIAVENPDASGFIVGQSVKVNIAVKRVTEEAGYLLPLQAVEVKDDTASVFMVNSEDRLQEVPVTLGEVVGQMVEVKEGLEDEMEIVSPVYDLKEGEKVIVRE